MRPPANVRPTKENDCNKSENIFFENHHLTAMDMFIGILLLFFLQVDSFNFENEELLARHVPTPDYIIADGKIIDRNSLEPERLTFFEENEIISDRQTNPPWYTSHYQALTQGIEAIDYTGWINSVVAICGEKTFPIAINGLGDVVIAGAEFGAGRVIVLPRYELATAEAKPSMITFVSNAILWLQNGKSPLTVATHTTSQVGSYVNTKKSVPPSVLAASPEINVYFLNGHDSFSAEDVAAIKNYVKNGGGLLVAGQAWAWADSTELSDKVQFANGFPGNKVTSEMGIVVVAEDWSRKISLVSPMPVPEYNVLAAIQSVIAGKTSSIAINTIARSAGKVINLVTNKMPEFRSLIQTAIEAHKTGDADKNKVVYSRLTDLLIQIELTMNPPVLLTASNVATFPYNLPTSAQPVTKTIQVDATSSAQPNQFFYSGSGNIVWRSTALYAKAGTIVTLTFPEIAIGKLEVQIGCHTDNLFDKENLLRSPRIVTTFEVTQSSIKAGNPWGGLVYIKVPHNSSLGSIQVTIANAFEAPIFVLGQTTNNDWNTKIKTKPAPWAEIEIPGQFILTMPTNKLVNVVDMNAIATVYESIILAENKLAGLEKRFRPERFVFDIHISGGWMHSGYPMMGFIEAVDGSVSLTNLQKYGTWGITHELGHNHQWKSWTIEANSETGCNWFSLYVHQKVFGLKWAHEDIQPEVSLARIHNWVLNGKPFADWNVWLALDTYSILAETFTWDSYTTLMKQYYALPEINDDNQKLDLWAQRYSQTVNTNLCPYFEWFGWPLSAETKIVCNKLPAWTQDPLKRFAAPPLSASCADGWIGFGDSCFKIGQEKLSWWNAEAKCQELGADSHLASCLSEKDLFFLAFQQRTTSDVFFVGISNVNSFSNFEFLDGSLIGDMSIIFSKSQINTHCAAVAGGKIKTISCIQPNYYICKRGKSSCGHKTNCPDSTWVKRKSSCYKYGRKHMSLQDAKAECTKVNSGASLAIIDDVEENTFLTQMATDLVSYTGADYYESYFLGLVSTGKPKEYTWSNGKSVSFPIPWCANEPSDSMREVVLASDRNYCWMVMGGEWWRPTASTYLCKLNLP